MTTTGIHDEALVIIVVVAGVLLLSMFSWLLPVILIVANRAEPDSRGLRPFTVYLFAMSLFSLLASYLGSVVIVTGVVSLFAPHFLPVANSVARQCLIGAIVVVIGGLTLAYHLRRGVEVARSDGRVDGPNARILHTYVSAVSFLLTGVVVIASGALVYLVFQLVAPGVFGGSSRGSTGRSLVEVIYVVVAGVVIVLAHLRYGPPRLLPKAFLPSRPGSGPSGGVAGPPPVLASYAVPAPAPAPPAPAPAPTEQWQGTTPLPRFEAPPASMAPAPPAPAPVAPPAAPAPPPPYPQPPADASSYPPPPAQGGPGTGPYGAPPA